MKHICLIYLLILSFASPLTAQDLEKINTEAYLSMMDADNLLKDKKAAEALTYYQKSLHAYESIKQQDPAFKKAIVDYRIDVLSKKIAELKQELPDAQPAAIPAPEADMSAEKDFKTLYLQTREKMVQDATRLLELEKRSIQMTTMMREKIQESDLRQTKIHELETQLKNAKTDQNLATTSLEKEVKDLTRFNNLLQERADSQEGINRQLTAERDELIAAGRELSGKVAVLEQTNKTLQTEGTEFKMNATQSEQRLILERNQLRDDLLAKNLKLEDLERNMAALNTQLLEIPQLQESVDTLNQRNENLNKEHTELQAEQQTTAAKLDAAEAALAEMERQKEKNLELKAESEAEVEAERAKGLNEQNGYREQIKTIAQQNSDLEKEIERLRKGAGAWEADNVALQAALAEREQKIQTTTANLQALQTAATKDNLVLKDLMKASETFAKTEAELKSQLKKNEVERDRLALNLKQESDQRRRLEKNAEQQLKSITDRMNEIIGLRQQISELKSDLEKARRTE